MDEAGLCKSKSSKKIPWTEMSVRVRFPSGAREQASQIAERPVFIHTEAILVLQIDTSILFLCNIKG